MVRLAICNTAEDKWVIVFYHDNEEVEVKKKKWFNLINYKMPPKKDEIDVNALPPLKHLCVGVRIESAKGRAAKLNNLLKECKSFQKNITRDEIIAFCKEK